MQRFVKVIVHDGPRTRGACEEKEREEDYIHMATRDRGFAAMDTAKQKSIASKGGKASAGKNLTTEARSKGGRNSHRLAGK